eukprot:TRINITY_DN68795_c0_g1_i1.p1 TRINITY_DN68795_c0_g1~~TRINITY_DN68795_c0_g1_i1.p1  ORF type:complete len:286 (-),score=85.17 TRINITY_DN68795_c0_g1_i1:191-1009(-)
MAMQRSSRFSLQLRQLEENSNLAEQILSCCDASMCIQLSDIKKELRIRQRAAEAVRFIKSSLNCNELRVNQVREFVHKIYGGKLDHQFEELEAKPEWSEQQFVIDAIGSVLKQARTYAIENVPRQVNSVDEAAIAEQVNAKLQVELQVHKRAGEEEVERRVRQRTEDLSKEVASQQQKAADSLRQVSLAKEALVEEQQRRNMDRKVAQDREIDMQTTLQNAQGQVEHLKREMSEISRKMNFDLCSTEELKEMHRRLLEELHARLDAASCASG